MSDKSEEFNIKKPKEFDIEEVWWHFEDQLKPSKCQLFRQVMDIYISEVILRIDFEGEDLFGLKILGRNFFNNEIPFVYDQKLILNLGSIENWPITPENTHHTKIEVRYGESNPSFKFNIFKFWQGYCNSNTIKWRIRPEFTITVPSGLEIPKHGKNLKLRLDRETDELGERWKLKYKDPVILKKDGKRVYTYVITEKSYDVIKEVFSNSSGSETQIRVSYEVHNDRKFFLIPFFSTILSAISLYGIYISYNLYLKELIDPNFNIQLIIVTLSLLGLSLTLHKENYEIPLDNLLYITIGLTVLGIIFSPTVGYWGPCIPLLISCFTELVSFISFFFPV